MNDEAREFSFADIRDDEAVKIQIKNRTGLVTRSSKHDDQRPTYVPGTAPVGIQRQNKNSRHSSGLQRNENPQSNVKVFVKDSTVNYDI